MKVMYVDILKTSNINRFITDSEPKSHVVIA